jgi:hypothetical protein
MATPKVPGIEGDDAEPTPEMEIELDESEDGDELQLEGDAAPLVPKWLDTTQLIRATRTDFPVSLLAHGVKTGMFDLAPHFQRRDRWPATKQSRFIESLVIGVPVPPILLREQKGNKFVVIDGRQRLTAISRFFDDSLRLTYLRLLPRLHRKRHKDVEDQGLLNHRYIPAIILPLGFPDEAVYETFERLNTGGVNLNPMEVRKATLHGPFLDLLVKLSETEDFCALWRLPTETKARKLTGVYKRMADLQLILRFFALQDRPDKCSESFKDWLSSYMANVNRETAAGGDVQHLEDRFLSAYRKALLLLGADALVPQGIGRRPSAPYSDIVLGVVSQLVSDDDANGLAGKLRAGIAEALTEPTIRASITEGTNGIAAMAIRREAARKVVNAIRDGRSG